MKIVITGATKGIGRAIADLFAEKGFDLAVCARTSEDLAQMKNDFEKKYPNQEILIKTVDMQQKPEVIYPFLDRRKRIKSVC